MVGNSNWIQPSVWLWVFDMLWFHCCLFFIDSRGVWDRSHKKCHYSKLTTFAFYCQLAYSVIHNLQILQVSLLLLSATLQYLHCSRTRGRVWFAPKLKLSQTSLQTHLNTRTDCTASAYTAVTLCSWSHGLILTCNPGSGCLILKSFLRTNFQDTALIFYWFLFRVLEVFFPLSNPFISWGCTLKKHKAIPYTEVWGPKSHTEAGSEGIVLHRAWQTIYPQLQKRSG